MISRNIGISSISQKMKNRNRSMAVKTPVTPMSRMRIRKKYSLTRVLRFHDASTATKNRIVESSISGRLIPSTPTW